MFFFTVNMRFTLEKYVALEDLRVISPDFFEVSMQNFETSSKSLSVHTKLTKDI